MNPAAVVASTEWGRSRSREGEGGAKDSAPQSRSRLDETRAERAHAAVACLLQGGRGKRCLAIMIASICVEPRATTATATVSHTLSDPPSFWTPCKNSRHPDFQTSRPAGPVLG